MHPTLSNYAELLSNANFLGFFWNSIKVTFCLVVLSMVVSVLAAFSLARMKFWGSGVLATGIFLTYLVPESLLFIPLFQIVGAVGLINNAWAMVPLYLTLSVPFCTWIMIGYFASIPKELDEAALIDGASLYADAVPHLHSGGDAGHHRGDDLLVHGRLGHVPLPDGLPLQLRPDGADGGHRQRPDPRRRVPVGQDHGRLA